MYKQKNVHTGVKCIDTVHFVPFIEWVGLKSERNKGAEQRVREILTRVIHVSVTLFA